MHLSALPLLAVSHLGFPMDQSIAGDLGKGCLEVEALILCPSAGAGHLDLGMDSITVRSQKGFKEEGDLNGVMLLPPHSLGVHMMLFPGPSVVSCHSMAMLRTCCTLWELI